MGGRRPVQGGDRGEGAQRTPAGGRDHPGGVRHRDILQRQSAVLDPQSGGDKSQCLQAGRSIHTRVAARTRHSYLQ